jgi:hypothetical protein
MAADFVPLDGNLLSVVDQRTGIVYNIPNFCINEPVYVKEFLDPEKVDLKIIRV